MKRKWKAVLLLAATIVISGISQIPAKAAEETEIDLNDASLIPDAALRTHLKEDAYDRNGDEKLSVEEIQNITDFYMYSCGNDCKNISDFTGIEYLTALKTFDISSAGEVTNLDLSKNTNLQTIRLNYAKKLSTISLGTMSELTSLQAYGTGLEALDVSQCPKLTNLQISGAKIKSLDVTANTDLMYLTCSLNQLTTLDVSKNTALKSLDCNDNQIETLDLSNCPNLEYLLANNNQLKDIDLSKNTKLKTVKVSYNQLAAVDTTSSAEQLTTFYCYNNKITKLDLTKNTNLHYFDASDNCLPALDLSNQKEIMTTDYDGYEIKIVEKQVYAVTPEVTEDSKYLLRIKKDTNSAFDSGKVIEDSISNSNATLTEDGFLFDKESDIPFKFTYQYETNANDSTYPMKVTVINTVSSATIHINYRNTSIFNWNNPNPWEYTMGSEPITLQPVEKEGATFLKWVLWNYSGNPKDLPAVTELSDDVITDAMTTYGVDYVTLRAVFDPDVVEIQYDREVKADGSIDSINDSSFQSNNPSYIEFGRTIVLNDATRDGYTFEGWYTDPYFTAESKVTEFCEEDEIYFTSRYLYAKWSQKSSAGNNGQTNSGTDASNNNQESIIPAVQGKQLTAKDKKCQVKVTSSDKANPTVAYVKPTDKNAKKVTIPDTVTVDGVTYKVTAIADNAFKGNKKITKITIGKNITAIGKDAFKNCKKLTTITIGKNVKTIGKNAFKGIDKKATFKLNGSKKTKTALKKKLKSKATGYVKSWKIK